MNQVTSSVESLKWLNGTKNWLWDAECLILESFEKYINKYKSKVSFLLRNKKYNNEQNFLNIISFIKSISNISLWEARYETLYPYIKALLINITIWLEDEENLKKWYINA